MAIDAINFSITCSGEKNIKRTDVLQRTNKEKTIKNQGKTGLIINEKQKKHVKIKR